MQVSAVMRLRTPSARISGPGSNSASSSAVEMCSTCRRVPCVRASEIASRVDLMQASRERMSGWHSTGMSSP